MHLSSTLSSSSSNPWHPPFVQHQHSSVSSIILVLAPYFISSFSKTFSFFLDAWFFFFFCFHWSRICFCTPTFGTYTGCTLLVTLTTYVVICWTLTKLCYLIFSPFDRKLGVDTMWHTMHARWRIMGIDNTGQCNYGWNLTAPFNC